MRARVSLIVSTICGLSLSLSGCDETTTAPEPVSIGDEVFVVVNSTESSVSLVPADGSSAQVVGIAVPGATPVSVAVHGNRAIVPLGLAHAVAVIDLASQTVERIIPLADGSGATGGAIENDSIAWVANPSLNTVTRVNMNSGDTLSIDVGVYPQAVAHAAGRVFVANANLVWWAPAGPAWLSVIDPVSLNVLDSVVLSGQNAAAMEFGDNGYLYVVNSGNFGSGDGSLSVVDPFGRRETDFIADIGEFPGSISWVTDDLLVVGSFGEGILEVDPRGPTLTRAGADGVMPESAGVSGLAADSSGMVYALNSTDCVNPGRVNILQPPDFSVARSVDTGVCPYAIERTWVRQ